MTISSISIIVPTLNEASHITEVLGRLQVFRERGHEVIVVDGGSSDTTVLSAASYADYVMSAPRGRAEQLTAGTHRARHPVLWFVHADTLVPDNADHLILEALDRASWGRFDVQLSGRNYFYSLRIVEGLMNKRSQITGIATGDQGIFVARSALEAVGGIPNLSLMEDVALSRLLKAVGRPACIKTPLITSSRRWEQDGIFRTIVLMWLLRSAYGIGISPKILKKFYR